MVEVGLGRQKYVKSKPMKGPMRPSFATTNYWIGIRVHGEIHSPNPNL